MQLAQGLKSLTAMALAATLAACNSATSGSVGTVDAAAPTPAIASTADFEADRAAILAMAGDFDVTFDFTEKVAFVEGYTLKDPKLSKAFEVVRVIEDSGDFISLQHILIVSHDGDSFPVKHWRQDWQYQPQSVLTFIGGNAWQTQDVAAADRVGAWSQTVYQVDDSPRYGAVGHWSHDDGISDWTPPASWRPLPRRDMTTRDDYHAVKAVNRHAITPSGWVHEQDNTKLVLSGAMPQALVREVGVNSYVRVTGKDVSVATDYWAATADYWAEVRKLWDDLEASKKQFALTLKGEPTDLYTALLGAASGLQDGDITMQQAVAEARDAMAQYTTDELPPLLARLRPTESDQAR